MRHAGEFIQYVDAVVTSELIAVDGLKEKSHINYNGMPNLSTYRRQHGGRESGGQDVQTMRQATCGEERAVSSMYMCTDTRQHGYVCTRSRAGRGDYNDTTPINIYARTGDCMGQPR